MSVWQQWRRRLGRQVLTAFVLGPGLVLGDSPKAEDWQRWREGLDDK